MIKISLVGVTAKGKNRIREHGSLWEVLDDSGTIRPELWIRSLTTGEERWLTNDFKIEDE